MTLLLLRTGTRSRYGATVKRPPRRALRPGKASRHGFVEKINCEGGGWFIRKYGPSGKALRSFGRFQKRRLGQCTLSPQYTSAIAVRGNLVVVAGQDFGCCDDPATDGWVRAFDARLRPRWEAQFEPPATIPRAWYDTAEGISIGAGRNVYVGGWASTEPPASGFDTFTGVGSVVLEKLDATGGLSWTHTTGATMFRGSGPVSTTSDRVRGGSRASWATRAP